MKQDKYIAPHAKIIDIQPTHIIAMSGGEQTEKPVHNPDDEVDAGSALVKQTGWDDWAGWE